MRRIIGGLAAGLTLLSAALAAGTATAGPRVAVDVPPVHSLVARVMEGRGAPELIVPPGASPHGFALRPSQASALAEAEVVVWVGAALTPWFAEAVDGLAARARSLELAEAPGAVLLPIRTGARFEAHDHGHGAAHDGGGHDDGAVDHAAHDHAARHADPDYHRDDAHHGDAHDRDAHHGDAHHDDAHHDARHDAAGSSALAGMDEHLWLDPRNARLWAPLIAEALAGADPEGAALYRANAAAADAELAALETEIEADLAPVRGRPYVVFHDAYQYFGRRFGMPAAGAVSLGDALRPSAARLEEIRGLLRELGAVCVFAEPQFSSSLLEAAVEGTDARRATLDPLGAELAPGPALYPALLRGLAASLRGCLG